MTETVIVAIIVLLAAFFVVRFLWLRLGGRAKSRCDASCGSCRFSRACRSKSDDRSES